MVLPAEGDGRSQGARRLRGRRARPERRQPRRRRLRREGGIPWVGYDADAQKFAPKQWLTAAVYNWGPYYVKRIKAAIDGTWKPGFYYGSIKDGFTKLAPFGPKVVGEDEGGDRGEAGGDHVREVRRLPRARSTTRAAS